MAATAETSGGAARATQAFADAMSRVARRLQEEHGDVEGTLHAITAAAVRTVPHTDECGVSYVVGRRRIESRASTGVLPRAVDDLQQRLEEGPCIDAVWREEVVEVPDVAADDRWPRFARDASSLGVRSMVCFQLFVDGDQLGALNLYSTTPDAFDDESRDMGLVFAGHAAVALAGAEHEANLRAGMGNRDVIGQAKGILMERYKLTADEAFGVLAHVSMDLNRRLVDIARELSETGAVPGGGRRHG